LVQECAQTIETDDTSSSFLRQAQPSLASSMDTEMDHQSSCTGEMPSLMYTTTSSAMTTTVVGNTSRFAASSSSSFSSNHGFVPDGDLNDNFANIPLANHYNAPRRRGDEDDADVDVNVDMNIDVQIKEKDPPFNAHDKDKNSWSSSLSQELLTKSKRNEEWEPLENNNNGLGLDFDENLDPDLLNPLSWNRQSSNHSNSNWIGCSTSSNIGLNLGSNNMDEDEKMFDNGLWNDRFDTDLTSDLMRTDVMDPLNSIPSFWDHNINDNLAKSPSPFFRSF